MEISPQSNTVAAVPADQRAQSKSNAYPIVGRFFACFLSFFLPFPFPSGADLVLKM